MDADELLAKQLKQMEKEKKEKGSKLKTQEKKVTERNLLGEEGSTLGSVDYSVCRSVCIHVLLARAR